MTNLLDFYITNYKYCRKLISNVIKDPLEAQDLLQELYFVLHNCKTKEVLNPKAYIQKVCSSKSFNSQRDNLKKKHIHIEFDFEMEHSYEDINSISTLESINVVNQKNIVLKRLENLPKRQKRIIKYQLVDNMSLNEIANKIGKTTTAIRTLNYIAINNLKETND